MVKKLSEFLSVLFDKYVNSFNTTKLEMEEKVIRYEYYNGYHYEIFPYYYQRVGFKKGSKLKDKNNAFYVYGFDQDDKLILIKELVDFLEDEYYISFIFYNKDYDIFVYYSYDEELLNISCYFKDSNNKYIRMESKGQDGSCIELYFYNSNMLLEKIEIQQYDNNHFIGTLYNDFIYKNNMLYEIYKYPENKSYRKRIYP